MRRTLLGWMREVLPHTWIVTFCISTEMCIELVYFLALWWNAQVDEASFRQMRLCWLGLWSFAYGVYRAFIFHPALNDDYRQWLMLTPWTPDKSLPAGPVRQRPQDLIVLAVLMLLTHEASVRVLYLPTAYLAGYLLVLACTTRLVGDWAFAYLLGFGLGAIALVKDSPISSVVVAMGCYPIAFVAIRRSLYSFPWDIDWSSIKSQFKSNPEEKHQDRLGWPYDFLSPKPPKLILPYQDGICLSLLLGWYAFVAQYHAVAEGRAMISFVTYTLVSIGVIARVWDYVRAHRPPISFGGRIWTRRLILPRYDVIFLAPFIAEVLIAGSQLGAMAIAFANNPRFLLNAPNLWLDGVAVGLSVGGLVSSMLILCVAGPILERWRLTGTHRIVFDLGGLGGKHSSSPFIEL